jgi:hypothetical protein
MIATDTSTWIAFSKATGVEMYIYSIGRWRTGRY